MTSFEHKSAINKILATRRALPAAQSARVAITGIDSSGKGFIAAQIVQPLVSRGLRVANINEDGWLNEAGPSFLP